MIKNNYIWNWAEENSFLLVSQLRGVCTNASNWDTDIPEMYCTPVAYNSWVGAWLENSTHIVWTETVCTVFEQHKLFLKKEDMGRGVLSQDCPHSTLRYTVLTLN